MSDIKQAIEKLREESKFDPKKMDITKPFTALTDEHERLQAILDRALKALEVAVSALDWYADVDPENTSEYTKAGLHLRAKATRDEIAAILESKNE